METSVFVIKETLPFTAQFLPNNHKKLLQTLLIFYYSQCPGLSVTFKILNNSVQKV